MPILVEVVSAPPCLAQTYSRPACFVRTASEGTSCAPSAWGDVLSPHPYYTTAGREYGLERASPKRYL